MFPYSNLLSQYGVQQHPWSGEFTSSPAACCLCHVFFISFSSSGSPAHDQISPSIGPLSGHGWPACLPDQNHPLSSLQLLWMRLPERTQASKSGFESLQRFGTQEEGFVPFLRWLILLLYLNMREIMYLFTGGEWGAVYKDTQSKVREII